MPYITVVPAVRPPFLALFPLFLLRAQYSIWPYLNSSSIPGQPAAISYAHGGESKCGSEDRGPAPRSSRQIYWVVIRIELWGWIRFIFMLFIMPKVGPQRHSALSVCVAESVEVKWNTTRT